MSRLTTAVAANFTCLATVPCHVAILPTSVALDLDAVFLDVAKFPASVALLFFLTVAVASQMTRTAADVTAQFPLSFSLGTIFSDVAFSPAVIAGVLEKIAVLGVMTSFTTAITDIGLGGGAALRTSRTTSWCSSSSCSFRTIPGPVARAPTLEAAFSAHGYGEIFQ